MKTLFIIIDILSMLVLSLFLLPAFIFYYIYLGILWIFSSKKHDDCYYGPLN